MGSHYGLGSKDNMQKFDVVIIGGGMVGAALALGLAKQKKQVAVVETAEPQPFSHEQAMDLRISAISQSSVNLMRQLGAWQAIADMRVCPYRSLETWEHPECRTRFSAEQLGLDKLGYMVENRVLQLGLWQQFSHYSNLHLLCPERLKQIEFEADYNVIHLQSDVRLQADWVVGADGANSQVRQLANIGITAWDYRQRCMLINVTTEQPQQSMTWQQFTPSGPRSFLPLADSPSGQHQACLVWYDAPQRIMQLQRLPAEQLRQQILHHFPTELGDIEVVQAASFPLTRRHAQRYFSRRCVLVGDAAHTINPLAGQGVNLGFKDVWTLLDTIADKGLDNEQALLDYHKRRRGDNLLMQTGMDVFYSAFSNDILPLKLVRNGLLKLADHNGELKTQALKYALGL